jgi:hypothetical protein
MRARNAGSLSTDGLLVVRVTAAAADSTPARIAQLAAAAQAARPQLARWLDGVGEVWTKVRANARRCAPLRACAAACAAHSRACERECCLGARGRRRRSSSSSSSSSSWWRWR